MLGGSSEVQSTKIPFATIVLILITTFVSIKAFSYVVQSDRESQHAFTGFFNNETHSTTAARDLEEFHDSYGFRLSHFREGNFLSIFTHMFIHFDLIKLVANMLVLAVFAIAMEELLGAAKFLGLYFIGAILAALAQGYFDLETTCPLVGANGGVAVVMGAYLVIFGSYSTVKLLFPIRLLGFCIREMPTQVFCAIWLYSQVKEGFSGASVVDIALAANVTGLVVGLVSGQLLKGSVGDKIVTTKGGQVKIDSSKKVEQTGAQKLDEALESQPFSVVAQAFANTNVPCPTCGSPLDMGNPVGDRLVRCGGKCSQMTYIDGSVLANSLTPQQV